MPENACKCGDCYHPVIGPDADGDPCDWCRDCGCPSANHTRMAHAGARRMSEHSAEIDAHVCCACFTHNDRPCCNTGHPQDWTGAATVKRAWAASPLLESVRLARQSTDENPPSTAWEHVAWGPKGPPS